MVKAAKKKDVERIRQKFDAAKSKHNIDFEAKEEQSIKDCNDSNGWKKCSWFTSNKLRENVMYVHPYHAVGGGVDNSCYLAINIANR